MLLELFELSLYSAALTVTIGRSSLLAPASETNNGVTICMSSSPKLGVSHLPTARAAILTGTKQIQYYN